MLNSVIKRMAEADPPSQTTCSRGHNIPSVGHILGAFSLQDSNVLNIYIVGSHLWETCRSSSDWDLVIVVNELLSVKPLNHHKGNIEAFIISKKDYVEQINKHSFQLLLTVWLPRIFVVKELFDPRTVFCLSLESLISALSQHKERDFRIAQKHFLKDNRSKARKILIHCIRYVDLGVQVKTGGQITDYTSTNTYREEILDNHCKEWSELLATVSPIFDSLWTAFLS